MNRPKGSRGQKLFEDARLAQPTGDNLQGFVKAYREGGKDQVQKAYLEKFGSPDQSPRKTSGTS